jgi:hypothetical protein
MYKNSFSRPRANIHRVHLWHSIEELAPHDALFWWGGLRYQIIFRHNKRPLTLQGFTYEETYTELVDYVCPVTNIRNLPPFSRQEACKCRTLLDFDPKPKGTGKYFNFRDDQGSFRIGKKVTQIYLYNPWETGSIFINSERPIHLLPGTNIICLCFLKYRFQKLKNTFGDNNTYNVTLIGGPLHRLVRIRIKNKRKAYFILYRKFHTCEGYSSQGEIPTLLELSKSALITGNIDYNHPDFQSFKNIIPRPVTLPSVYPLHVRLQYFDYLFYQFNDGNAQCHSCTAQKISHFLPINNNRFDTGNCR